MQHTAGRPGALSTAGESSLDADSCLVSPVLHVFPALNCLPASLFGSSLLPAPGLDREAVLAEVSGMRWGDFKPRLADALVAHLQPIQARYTEVMADEGALDGILAKV